MKTQHLYFRYLFSMDLTIKILFSLNYCTSHILSKEYLKGKKKQSLFTVKIDTFSVKSSRRIVSKRCI